MKHRTNLAMYQKVLPSLDLKRRQLQVELTKAEQALSRSEKRRQELIGRIGQQLPMLASPEFPVAGLVTVESLEVSQENVVGTRLPKLGKVTLKKRDYSDLGTPHWIDALVERLEQMTRNHFELEVARLRAEALRQAVRKVTQRVSLFDKVLIPEARQAIKRIQLALDESEREAVIRSKIIKRKSASR